MKSKKKSKNKNKNLRATLNKINLIKLKVIGERFYLTLRERKNQSCLLKFKKNLSPCHCLVGVNLEQEEHLNLKEVKIYN